MSGVMQQVMRWLPVATSAGTLGAGIALGPAGIPLDVAGGTGLATSATGAIDATVNPPETPNWPTIRAPVVGPAPAVASNLPSSAGAGLVASPPAPGSVSGGSSAAPAPSSDVLNQAIAQARSAFAPYSGEGDAFSAYA
jgi:hypothetical protein